ncbi:TlpA disulfide reductase family protein [Flammeovirga aprica]|uniref:AhpC/TSA family protein n=1 Tax=Flammeovirga aprica JL-4 TaxID=694437 RepID=A0A7X9XC07_9BACT|nr:TlpA disulfide reductase family protein [Flammeovirga aprica]NME71248.1 AhpC/TSA family protein [Flammeovirga aprica JL-4]
MGNETSIIKYKFNKKTKSKMKLITNFLLLFVTVFFFNCSSTQEQLLEINGKTVGVDTKSIILINAGQYPDSDSLIKIPVKDGKFYYKAKLDFPQYVELCLGESFMPLFLTNEKINVTIHSEEEFDKNVVEGGELNAQYQKYKVDNDHKFSSRIETLLDSMGLLSKSDQLLSEKAKPLFAELRKPGKPEDKVFIRKKIRDLKDSNQHLSSKAQTIDNKLKLLYKKQKEFQQEYIENNPSIVSYFFFIQDLMYHKERVDINIAKKNLQLLSDANPNHPYNTLAYNLTKAIDNIKVGKKYVDFSAPDLNGDKIKLSEKIENKIALLDLWATWCGPCIVKSRTMVPVYNDFKDKGFTIIGVAGERENTDKFVRFLEKEKWPWLNLVEVDDQNNIWQKYNIAGSGGGIFLIDENGLILAKDPTAEEVRKVLESRLN